VVTGPLLGSGPSRRVPRRDAYIMVRTRRHCRTDAVRWITVSFDVGPAEETMPHGDMNQGARAPDHAEGTMPHGDMNQDTRAPDHAEDTVARSVLSGLLVRIDHVGIAVPDLEVAIAFWEGLGLHLTHREINEEQAVAEAMLEVGPGDPDVPAARVQLLAPTGADSPLAKFLEKSGQGLQQLAFTVTDVDAAAAALRAAGMRVLYDQARRGTAGSRINFVHPKDCGGVLIELVEPVLGNHP
jgi:methylmalonyl-CoA/ethylmalonyl-CoA epimerase